MIDDAPLRGIYWNPPPFSPATCTVCTTPIEGAALTCHQCRDLNLKGHPLADWVAPLSWAVMGSQAYADVHGYKRPHAAAFASQDRLQRLITIAFQRHNMCLGPEWRTSSLGFVAVPSTAGRTPHALTELVQRFAPQIPTFSLRYLGDPAEEPNARRAFRPTSWEVNVGELEGMERVVVIDDSWVTGGHAQSVASMLKTAGVPRVGIVTFARVLRSDWGPTANYLRTHGWTEYESRICPVHRVAH